MSEIDVLNLRAKQILNENDKGSYTIPNESLYPFQWNWDSAFAAFGFAQFDIPFLERNRNAFKWTMGEWNGSTHYLPSS